MKKKRYISTIHLAANPGLAAILNQARGEAVELTTSEKIEGRILGVEKVQELEEQGYNINLITAKGLQSIRRRELTYIIKNRGERERTILLEQPVDPGWQLVTPAKAEERTRSFYRFKVKVGAAAGGNSEKSRTLLINIFCH